MATAPISKARRSTPDASMADAITARVPSALNGRARAAPMPCAAPVTTTTLSLTIIWFRDHDFLIFSRVHVNHGPAADLTGEDFLAQREDVFERLEMDHGVEQRERKIAKQARPDFAAAGGGNARGIDAEPFYAPQRQRHNR